MPMTLNLEPVASIIMLAGIYYGAMYGGSTTSILINLPGEAASVITCLDGYQMAKEGRAGQALGIAAFSSFIAGTIATFGLALLAPPVAKYALRLGPPEYFTLVILGMVAVTFLSQGSMLKSMAMIILGVILSMVGRDMMTGYPRFTYGISELEEGLDFVAVIMGLFGVSEILMNVESSLSERREVHKKRITGLLPSRKDWSLSIGPIMRGSILGFFLGTLPGGGAVLGSFASYAAEKKIAKNPQIFGKGAIQGVAGPEAANNAASQSSFIPLLTLGIPSNSVMALLVGVLMIHGVQPGPLLMSKTPEIFWGVITSMYLGNIFLLVLNLPLIGLWVRMLLVPYGILFPLILMFCIIGTYSINNRIFEIYLMVGFGVGGYILRKFDYDLAPLILAFVLGPMLEDKLRHSLLIYDGDLSVFIRRPIAVTFLIMALLLAFLQFIPSLRRRKAAALKE
jgi:putative tricarboxylic transport membrane protein